MKRMFTISQRVDTLLREGVDNPKKWMIAHGYKEPDDLSGVCDEWKKLRDHHLQETLFLFDIINEMSNRLLKHEQPHEDDTLNKK